MIYLLSCNSQRYFRTARCCNLNVICPKYNRETEGGKTFRVTCIKLWNMLPLHIKREQSISH